MYFQHKKIFNCQTSGGLSRKIWEGLLIREETFKQAQAGIKLKRTAQYYKYGID